MRSFFALFAKGFTRQFGIIAHAVPSALFPAKETTFGVFAAASTLCRITDIFWAEADVTTIVAASLSFRAAHGAVLVWTFWATTLAASTGCRCVIVGDCAERAVTAANRFFGTFSIKGTCSTFGNLTTRQTQADITVRSSAHFDAVTIASHHFTRSTDGLAGAGFSAYRKRAATICASCTAFTGVVIITCRAQRSGIQGTGATVTSVGALVIGQARVNTDIVDAAKAFRTGFHRASSTVEAEIRINALTAIAKRRTSALTGNARFAVVEAHTVIVLSTRLTRFTCVRLVTSNACAAGIVRVTSWSYATCLVLRTRVIVTCAVVPIA